MKAVLLLLLRYAGTRYLTTLFWQWHYLRCVLSHPPGGWSPVA